MRVSWQGELALYPFVHPCSRSWYKRAYITYGRLASEMFRESGAGTHLIPTSSCRAAIKLCSAINGLRRFTAVKKAISRTNRMCEKRKYFLSLSLSLWILIPISSSVDRSLILIISMRIIWRRVTPTLNTFAVFIERNSGLVSGTY